MEHAKIEHPSAVNQMLFHLYFEKKFTYTVEVVPLSFLFLAVSSSATNVKLYENI